MRRLSAVGGSQHNTKGGADRAKFLLLAAHFEQNLLMVSLRRRSRIDCVWLLPAIALAAAIPLIAAAILPSDDNLLLTTAILCALPWSLTLLFVELSGGFADRAAWIVCVGLVANVALLWGLALMLKLRLGPKDGSMSKPALTPDKPG